MTEEHPYELVVSPPARRALTDHLPEPVTGFLATALIASPRRVGKPLRGDLAGIWWGRRGTYRVFYRVREDKREVVVVRIDHRGSGYRPR